MVSNFHMPPTGFGPGSQPDEGETLEFMAMPQDMRAYSAHIPDLAVTDNLRPAMALLAEVASAATVCGKGGGTASFDLSALDASNRRLIAETLGQGEVSIRIHARSAIAAQESVFAGIWVLQGAGVDRIEIAPVPALARDRAFDPRRPATGPQTARAAGVVNAPPIAVELCDRSASWRPGRETHVVNLTLLPHTPEDLDWLDAAFGQGAVDILSRGYGNCRVEATALAHVWRVRFYNSMDVLILDTFEVTAMPEVALAAPEDLRDSGERLVEVLEAMA